MTGPEPDGGSGAGWGVSPAQAPHAAWNAAAAGAASAIAVAARDAADPAGADGTTPLHRPGAADQIDPAHLDQGTRTFAVPESARYADGGLLGKGGMGVVTATLDRRLGRVVARKQVAHAAKVDPTARVRLAREAAITARLDHPGIVPVYDAGVGPDGEPFYTMRLVMGRTLADAIAEQVGDEGRFRLLRRALAAVEAIAYAHDKGVIHRDLKPANILLGSFGEAQVVDWGLARQLELDGEASGGATAPDTQTGAVAAAADADGTGAHDAAITRIGAVVGTPGYLAPEVAAGAPHGKRSDVYGLGVALREIVASAEVPAELQAILDCATAADPAARYADAGALAEDLEAWLDGRRVTAHRYSPWEHLRRLARLWRTPLWIAGAALASVAAVLVGALVWTSNERDAAVDAERRAVAAHGVANRSLARALLGAAQASAGHLQLPEAEILAAQALAVAEDPLARGLLMRARMQTATLRAPPTPLPADCVRRDWSRDGALGACARDGSLELWQLEPPRLRWRRTITAHSLALTERHMLVSEGIGEMTRLDLATGDVLAPSPPPSPALSGDWPPGDRADQALRFNVAQVAIVDAATGALQTRSTCGGRFTVAAARCNQGPNSGSVAVVCEDGTLTVLDAAGLAVASTQTGLDQRHRSVGVVHWSRDCTSLYLGTHDGTVAALAMPGGRPRFALEAGVGQVVTLVGDERWLVVAGERGGVELRHPATGVLLGRLPARAGRELRLRADGELRTFGRAMWRWQLPASPVALALPNGTRQHGLAAAALAPDGRHVGIARADGAVLIAPIRGGAAFVDATAFGNIAKFAVWTADGDALVVSGIAEPGLRRYRLAGDGVAQQPTLPALRSPGLRRVVVLASGALMTIDYGGTLAWADPAAAASPLALVQRPDSHRPSWLDLSIDAAGRRAVAVDSAGALELCHDGRPVRCAPLGAVAGAEVAALPSREGPIYVGGLGQIVELDAAGSQVARADTGGIRVHDLAISPDDEWLVAAQLDGRIRILERATLRLRALAAGHDRRVAAVSFDASGRMLASASWDGSVLLWDVPTLALPAATLVQQATDRWGLALDDVLDADGGHFDPSEAP